MQQYLGKTVLYALTLAGFDGRVFHGLVEKLSPSGKYVRIDWEWLAVDKINVLETLPNEDKAEPAAAAPPANLTIVPAATTAPEPVPVQISQPPAPPVTEAPPTPAAETLTVVPPGPGADAINQA